MRRQLAVVAIASITAFGMWHGTNTYALSDLTSRSGVTVSEAMEFRMTFGFETDIDAVAALMSDADADVTFGVPLTEAEADNMRERQRLESLSGPGRSIRRQ